MRVEGVDPGTRTTRGGPSRRRGRWPLAGLLLVTALVYLPGLSDHFVYDDHRFIPENEEIRDLSNFTRFFTDLRTMTMTHGAPGWDDIYRPLRTLSYAIDWAIFGDRAVLYRLENLIWHLVAVVLAWVLLRRLLDRDDLATIGAGLFALHPLQTQTVAWVSSRGDVMAAVFVLGACLFLLREEASGAHLVLGIVFYALGLLCKENAISFLAIVPIYDRIVPARQRFRRALMAWLCVVTGLFLLVRFSLATGQIPFQPDTLLGAGSATFILLAQTLLPTRLIPYTGDVLFEERVRIAIGGWLLATFAVLVLVALVRGRRRRGVAFGFLWAAMFLAPVSGLVPLKSVAESRFAYLPLLGVGMLLALLVGRLGRAGRPLAALSLLLFAALTVREVRTWRTDLDLWLNAVRQEADYRRPAPGKRFLGGDLALANCGVYVAKSGDHAGALRYFEEAIAIRQSVETWRHIATANASLGRHELALDASRRGHEMNPADATMAEAHGRSLLIFGQAQEAIAVLGPAVERVPRHVPVRGWLGAALLDAGRTREAQEQFETCLSLRPGDPWVAQLLAIAHLQLGDAAGARRILDRLLARDPGNAAARATWIGARAILGETVTAEEFQALLVILDQLEESRDVRTIQVLRGLWPIEELTVRHRLVRSLIRLRRRVEAEERLTLMLRRWPDDLETRANLGMVRVGLGRHADAIPLLRTAVARDPKSFILHLELARAYRGVNRPEDAQDAARKALALVGDEQQRAAMQRYLAGR